MKKLLFIYFAFITAINAYSLEIASQTKANLDSCECHLGVADIVEPLMPSVVNIYTVTHRKNLIHQNNPADPFYKFFEQFDFPFGFEELYQDPKATAAGSGFIIDPAGYIVTNHHVIEDSEEINVKLNDNLEFSAKLVGSDPRTDLALLKIDSKSPLPSVKFGDSTKARVGDFVIAIGNPFGLGGTVTTGIISSKARDVNPNRAGIVDNFIQTDASINVGNSGGPMFNAKGEVIGVNTAILASPGSNIGFAIPSSTVQTVIEQLKSHGKVSRGLLSIKIQEITPQIAEAMNLKTEEGVLVVEADPKGAGSKAGLKPGDIIMQIGDVKVTNSRKLQILVAETPVNSIIKIDVLRNGEKKQLECKLIEDVANIPSAKRLESKIEPYENNKIFVTHGITFLDKLDPEFEEDGSASGVVVVGKIVSAPEWRGLMKGDIVLSVNQHPISNVKEFEEIYNKVIKDGKKHIVLFVKRYGDKLFLALPL